ncbi:thioredoxin fold domain-containing protein [Marinomonas sp. TI.3.20]|uniref:thioredoxin fold domain-containing protein n=1 Tax=Marinomonas sp. TI.3.20 TaxID=3121296 RepID=UPI00311EBA1B
MNCKSFRSKAFGILAVLASFTAHAGSLDKTSPDFLKYESYIKEVAPGLSLVDVVTMPKTKSVILVTDRGSVINMSRKGDIVYSGDLLKWVNDGYKNLTQQALVDRIRAQPNSAGIFYPAKGKTTATVDIFFDVDCTFCRAEHDDIDMLNTYGISVRYHAYPGAGPESPSAAIMAKMWCEPDAKKRIDYYIKTNEVLSGYHNEAACKKVISDQYFMGRTIDIKATPAITFPNGRVVFSYLTPKQVLQYAVAK